MHAVERPPCPKPPRRMRTLGDAVASMTFEWSQLECESRNKEYQYEYATRSAAYAVSVVLDSKDDWESIPLPKLIGLDAELIDYALEEGFERRYQSRYATEVRRILTHASSRGWTCKQMNVLKSWDSPLDAFQGETLGCLQIIEYLISEKKTPATTKESDLETWRQLAEADGLEPSATEQYLKRFRGKMRAAGLEKMFPNLDLKSKRRSQFADPLKKMTLKVRSELKGIAKFKSAAWLAGRTASEAAEPPTIAKIYKSFRQLHGHRTRIRKQKPVASLVHLVTPENVFPFIDFLYHERGLLRDGVIRSMAPILSVVRSYTLFKKRNYEWINERVKQVPKERHYKILMRKEEKAQPHEVLGQIPKALRRDSLTPELSELDVARYRHDEALISVLHELVFRQRNIRFCQTLGTDKPNLVWKRLTTKMRLDLFIPDCVNRAREQNPRRKFLMFSFDESQTKGKRFELVVMPLALATLIMEYNDKYRVMYIPKERDHGQLFADRCGGEFAENTLRNLVCRLTKTYTGHKVPPHIWRDIFAAHIKMLAALGMGGGRKQIRRRFFHTDDETTDGYSQLDYALPGIARLDQEYQSAA